MQYFILFLGILQASSAFARTTSVEAVLEHPTEKLACRASGKLGIQSVIVEPTDLTGQICAQSADNKGELRFYVSNGSIHDDRILIKSTFHAGWGEDTVYLKRAKTADGKLQYTLEEWTVCDENDLEFCRGEYKAARLSKVDPQLICEVIRN